MERGGKPSISTQYQVADGKIVALQADPECKEMRRMVADVNRRVIRVQTHGMAKWEAEAEKGRPRGFGVEVAREAAEEQDAEASGSAPFYTAADEPEEQRGEELVQQYLEDVEQAQGKPGPVKRTVRRWVYGKPAEAEAEAEGPADSCCCRQVEAVAGKMTIAEASGMRDEAVDRLLVNVYFQPPPKRGAGSRVFRRATEVSRRVSERVKSVARRVSQRVSHRLSEYRARKSSAPREDAVGPEADTVQLRQSRGPPGEGERATAASRRSQPQQAQADDGAEAAPRETPRSSEEEQFYSARSSGASSEERAGSSAEKGKLQPGHNVGVYQVLLEGDDEDADGGTSCLHRPPHPRNRKADDRKEHLGGDKSLTGNHKELSHCDRHKSITEDDRDVKRLRIDLAKAEVSSEQHTSNSERSDWRSWANEKSKSPDPASLNSKDTGTSGTHVKEERREQRLETSQLKLDLQLRERDRTHNQGDERRIVGSLDVFILDDATEFGWEPIPECSEEEVLASQCMGGLEFDEDSLQNGEDTGPLHSKEGEEVSIEPERVEANVQDVEQEATVEAELVEENIPNENGSTSKHTVKGARKTV